MEKYLAELANSCWQFPKKKDKNPFKGEYERYMNDTPALEHELSSWYQSLIGVLRWMVEIGRVDIITKVSMMASQITMPREGHLEAFLHFSEFLRQKFNSGMSFDPTYPVIDMNDFKEFK